MATTVNLTQVISVTSWAISLDPSVLIKKMRKSDLNHCVPVWGHFLQVRCDLTLGGLQVRGLVRVMFLLHVYIYVH